MTELEIGEYLNCTHGPGGGRKFGCVPCALEFKRQEIERAKATVRGLSVRLVRLERVQGGIEPVEPT